MACWWIGRFLLLAAIVVSSMQPARAQGPDDPFYDWDLERYRLLRSPDDPTGGILPLPDRSTAPGKILVRSSSVELETAGVSGLVAAEEKDGRRIRDGTRLRYAADGLLPLRGGWRVGLAGRLTLGDGQRSGGQWLERNLVWTGERGELRIGLTRGFWGDGSAGSLLLGRTAPPLEMIRVRTARPLRLPHTGSIGRLHGSLFLAYLDDRDRTIPYPLLHGMRVEWEPGGWIRLTASRTIMLGGAGRTEKLKLRDVWDILWARNENLVGERPVSDTDQKASFAAELRLPPGILPLSWLQGARLFYEYAGEDSFEGVLPTAVAHHMGGTLLLRGWVLLAEFTETDDDANYWYTNHSVYGPKSYYYRDYLLGHPIGGDGRLGHLRFWTPVWRGSRAIAWFRARGFWDRESAETPLWEDGLGLRVRTDLAGGSLLEVGLAAFRTRGSLEPLPRPEVRWRLDLALRIGGPSLPGRQLAAWEGLR